MRAFRLVAVLVVASTGCWAIVGLEDRPVGSATTSDGGGTDATIDVQQDVVSPPVDATTDAPADGGTRLCALHADAAICDDFDDTELDTRWLVEQYATGTVTRGAPAKSDPNAIVFYEPGTNSGARARIERTINGPNGKMTCSFDQYYDIPSGSFEIAHFVINGSGSSNLLTVMNDGLKTPDASVPITPPAAGTWVHLTVTFDVAGGVATISKNGATPATLTLNGFPSPQTTTASWGLRFIPGGELKFRMDNLYCEVGP